MNSVTFSSAIAAALKAAREHAVLVRDIDEAKHIAICYQFAESVRRVFSEATLASDALRAHTTLTAAPESTA